MLREIAGVALLVLSGQLLSGCWIGMVLAEASDCPPLTPYCSGDSVVSSSYDNSTDCGIMNTSEYDCAQDGKTCSGGTCVARPPRPKERCPNGGDGVCRTHQAFRCEGGYLSESPDYCPARGTECLLVPGNDGHVQSVCSLSDEPCLSVADIGAECQGRTRVGCVHGYPVEKEDCDGPNEICLVTDSTNSEGAVCALDLPCPPADGTACDGDSVYHCDDGGIGRVVRECSTLGHHCTEANGRGLCAVSEDGARDLVFRPIEGGTFEMTNASPRVVAEVTDFEILETEVTVAQYAACEATGLCTPPDEACRYDYNHLSPWLHGDLPVTCLRFAQAQEFCTFIGAQLPTEIQWEYALRNGGDPLDVPSIGANASCVTAILTHPVEFYSGCGRGEPWPGCSRDGDVTEQGVCDLVGNVEEWVMPVVSQIGPMGTRGGSYQESSPELFRSRLVPNAEPTLARGFRCARVTGSF